MCYVRFGAYSNHMHIQIIVKKLVEKIERKKKKKEKKTQQHRLDTNVGIRGFKAGLLARSQFASGPASSIKVFRGCSWSQSKF
jgi:hypothetical protein